MLYAIGKEINKEIDRFTVDDGTALATAEQVLGFAGQADPERAVLVDECDEIRVDLVAQHVLNNGHDLRRRHACGEH